MLTITVGSAAQREPDHHRLYLGSGKGSYDYQVRLSPKAANLCQPGDQIRVWDAGQSEFAYVPCEGEIIKPSGWRIQLRGSRDIGIHTGHPPHMSLKMQQTLKVCWEYERTARAFVRHKSSGREYKYKTDGLSPCLGDLSLEWLEKHGSPVDPLPPLPPGRSYRAYVLTDYGDWEEIRIVVDRKIITMTDTDRVEILPPC